MHHHLCSTPAEHLILAPIQTKLGYMLALANTQALLCLKFVDEYDPAVAIAHLSQAFKTKVSLGSTAILSTLACELTHYFSGQALSFKIPLQYQGTPFQRLVWQALLAIPYGETRSYAEIAQAINQPSAARAVALANAANPFALIVPCHRVILANGKLGGYNAGILRKQYLLEHESCHQEAVSIFSS